MKNIAFLCKTIKSKYLSKQDLFQKHVCPPWCKIPVYLLCRSKTCPNQVSKRLKYIKWKTHWVQNSDLTLTFEHVTWRSIRIIYILGATPAPSLVLIKWRGQKILTLYGLNLTFEHVTWKSIGIIYSLRKTPTPSLVLIK